MSESPLQLFIELVAFDQGTYALEDDVQQVKQEIEALEVEQTRLIASLESIQNGMRAARKEVDGAELKMREFEQNELEKKKRLDQVSNQKEYKSIVQEIEALKKRQHDYEETLLTAWNKFEATKRDYEQQMTGCDKKVAELKETIEQKKKSLASLEADLAERIKQHDERRKRVPKEWLEKYILMRSRVSNPVVPVVSGSCSACFYNLPPQDSLELRRNKMLQCKGCYRFLYMEPTKKEESAQQSQESSE